MRVSLDQRLDIREGREIEVCYDYQETGFKSVWYKAIIEAKPPTRLKSGLIKLSLRLLKDDSATLLTQLSEDVFLRPLPPSHLQARIKIKQGCVVDAYHKDGWWTGSVVKEMEDNKTCLVFFHSPPDIILFERKDLRPHLKWVHKKWWVHKKQRLTEESMFSSGTMVEVSSKTDNMEIVWAPAMIIREDDEKKNYLVKFCNKPLSCEDNKEIPNVTVDSHSVRPTPPPFVVEDYKLLDSVEAFRGSKWRKGIVKRVVSQKWYMVSFEDTKKQLKFNHSDLRPPMDWQDGVWKTRELPLAQGSGKKIGGSVMNGDTSSPSNESLSPVISSPVITSTQLKHTEAETQGKTFPKKTFQPMRIQNGLENESTREKGKPEKQTPSDGKRNNSMALETRNVQTKEPLLAQGLGNEMADGLLNGYTLDITPQVDSPGKTSNKKTLEPLRNGNESTREKMPEEHNSEDNSRKRKRGELEHNSDLNETVLSSDRTPNVMKSFAAADDERTKAKDATMVLPFVKKSPVWKTYESMEVFKRVPQSPHFSPLFETKEDFREGFALGMMVTFSGVLEKVKDLKTDVPLSQLNSLKDSFTELKKHGFNVTTPLSRINKLLALKDRQVNILKELEGFDKDMTDESSDKRKAEEEFGETERKILEVKHKILELQRQEAALEKQKDATYEKICQMESRARDLGVELEDVEFEFETILSAPW